MFTKFTQEGEHSWSHPVGLFERGEGSHSALYLCPGRIVDTAVWICLGCAGALNVAASVCGPM